MFIKYKDLKLAVYTGIGVGGLFLLFLARNCFITAISNSDSISYFITSLILLIVGIVCVVFAVDTCLLREDPDIWR